MLIAKEMQETRYGVEVHQNPFNRCRIDVDRHGGSAPAMAQTVWGGGVAVSPAPYYGYGYYDYAPGTVVAVPDAYDAAPYSYGYSEPYPDYSDDFGWRRPGHCHMSIRGC